MKANLDLGTILIITAVLKAKGQGLYSKRPKSHKAVRTVDLDARTVDALRKLRASQSADAVVPTTLSVR